MTPSRKKIVGAIASAVAALTLLGGTASAADAAPRPAKQVQHAGKDSGSNQVPTVRAASWKPY